MLRSQEPTWREAVVAVGTASSVDPVNAGNMAKGWVGVTFCLGREAVVWKPLG
jgi:hypothetical protein